MSKLFRSITSFFHPNSTASVEVNPQKMQAPTASQKRYDTNRCWENYYSKKYGRIPINEAPVRFDAPFPPDEHHLRFVCISDTHEQLGRLLNFIPNGDVLIHAGDFTNVGQAEAIAQFNTEIGTLPHRHKIVIAGNHELGLEDGEDLSQRGKRWRDYGTPGGYRLLTNCTYLQDQVAEPFGKGIVRIYGSPWHPLAGFSFYRAAGESIRHEWDKIPPREGDTEPIDILVTHTPPLGHMDSCDDGHVGCAELLESVEERVLPKYHIFGHIHEQHGLTTNMKQSTVFINASICDNWLNVVNRPIVFDYRLPKGVTRSDLALATKENSDAMEWNFNDQTENGTAHNPGH